MVELWDHLLLTPPPLSLSHPHALEERKGERQLQSPPLSQVCSPSLPPSLPHFLSPSEWVARKTHVCLETQLCCCLRVCVRAFTRV